MRDRWPALVPLALLLAVALGIGARVDGGRPLVWDGPLTHLAVSHRSAGIDDVALAVTRLGSWVVVFPIGLALALLAARRSRDLALVIVVTLAARAPVEWALKALVARPRPVGDRLVRGTGFSYPSGHVLAAAATWAFLPPVVALYTRRRAWWWFAVATAAVIVVLVAWSRVWLGVHWTSDVVGSFALAFLGFSGVEAWLDQRARTKGRGVRGPPMY